MMVSAAKSGIYQPRSKIELSKVRVKKPGFESVCAGPMDLLSHLGGFNLSQKHPIGPKRMRSLATRDHSPNMWEAIDRHRIS